MKHGEMTSKIKNTPALKWLFSGTFSAAGSLISIVVFLVVVAFIFFSRSSAVLGDKEIKISATLVAPVEINYDEIDSVSMLELPDIDLGEKASGFSNLFTVAGSYSNADYGIYDVYLSKSNDENAILINYLDVGYALFNLSSSAETEHLYEELLTKTA